MTTFNQLPQDANVKEVISAAFSLSLDIDGGWGYTKEDALIIKSADVPLSQFMHTFASMRALLEMSMTLPKEQRYAAINVTVCKQEQLHVKERTYEKVTCEISAIKEDIYNAFVEEYKEAQERADFDISEHFQRRKEATLKRKEIYWFEVKENLKL